MHQPDADLFGHNEREPCRAAARSLDQFYTRPDVAASCIALTLETIRALPGSVLFIEPAAGTGAFLDLLPQPKIGIDIAPPAGRPDLVKADFLSWRPLSGLHDAVVISNFPFGKNSSLALKFLNHAGSFAAYIASILPRTFEKESTKRRVRNGLELVRQVPLPPDSFIYENRPYSVPVVFQIWRRTTNVSVRSGRALVHPDFAFLKTPREADFAFQRVGARAGKVSEDGLRLSPQSHYFIKASTGTPDVRAILSGIDWDPIKHRTAGNPSIGKAELIAEYRKALQ